MLPGFYQLCQKGIQEAQSIFGIQGQKSDQLRESLLWSVAHHIGGGRLVQEAYPDSCAEVHRMRF